MTGNDLARVLHWGPGYNGEGEPLGLLRDVIDAEEIKLDRYVLNVILNLMPMTYAQETCGKNFYLHKKLARLTWFAVSMQVPFCTQ